MELSESKGKDAGNEIAEFIAVEPKELVYPENGDFSGMYVRYSCRKTMSDIAFELLAKNRGVAYYPREVAELTNLPPASARDALKKLVTKKLILKHNGLYFLPKA